MLSTLMHRRSGRLLAAAIALAGVAACNDDPAGPEEEDPADAIATIRFTVTPGSGTAATYALSDNGTLTPSPMRLPVGTATVRADFLDDGGTVITNEIPDDEFVVRFSTPPAGVTFARTEPFAGTFTATTAGTGTMAVDLYHTGEQHEDFGPFTVSVQIGG